jgi:hypothetical protein
MGLGLQQVAGFAADMQCISSMWFRKIQGGTHKERLESFYGPQAHACKETTYSCGLTKCVLAVAGGRWQFSRPAL